MVVVGAGPAGSLAARFAALGGASTLLVDQRPELGHPVQCGEFVPTVEEVESLFPGSPDLAEAFDVPKESILAATHRMVCVAPSGREYRFPLEGFSVSRRAFDKALALRAEAAGAELRYPAGVTRVHGSAVHFARGDPVEAKVIVGADGPLSVVARSAGYRPPRFLYRMITANAPGTFPAEIRLCFGSVAPGGYAWVIPKSGEANVGLGLGPGAAPTALSQRLDRFLAKEGLEGAGDRTTWWVPIGPPPASAVAGRSLLVGDAANLVMATNGGGIPTAMISGRDAGVAAARHVRLGRPLSDYDDLWQAHLFGPLATGHAIKRFADRVASNDALLALGMRYIGAPGLDAMMRLHWPARLGGAN